MRPLTLPRASSRKFLLLSGLLISAGAFLVTGGGSSPAAAGPSLPTAWSAPYGSEGQAATTQTFTLTARAGHISTPDGNTVYMWSFADGDGHVPVPRPVPLRQAGRHGAVILHNTLPGRRLDHLPRPGRRSRPTAWPPRPCSTTPVRITSLTPTAAADGGVGDLHLRRRPSPEPTPTRAARTRPCRRRWACSARSSCGPPGAPVRLQRRTTEFDPRTEFVQLLSDIDPAISQRGRAGRAPDITPYHPRYWMINGRSFPDTIAPNNADAGCRHQPYSALIHTVAESDASPPIVRYVNVTSVGHTVAPARRPRPRDRTRRRAARRAGRRGHSVTRTSRSRSARARPSTRSTAGTTRQLVGSSAGQPDAPGAGRACDTLHLSGDDVAWSAAAPSSACTGRPAGRHHRTTTSAASTTRCRTATRSTRPRTTAPPWADAHPLAHRSHQPLRLRMRGVSMHPSLRALLALAALLIAPATAAAAPSITLTTPADGAVYATAPAVHADFACAPTPARSPRHPVRGDRRQRRRDRYRDRRHEGVHGHRHRRRRRHELRDPHLRRRRERARDRTDDARAGRGLRKGEVVNASYNCADLGGAGMASCTGTVPNGQPLDTTPGTHTFTVTGNRQRRKHHHGHALLPRVDLHAHRGARRLVRALGAHGNDRPSGPEQRADEDLRRPRRRARRSRRSAAPPSTRSTGDTVSVILHNDLGEPLALAVPQQPWLLRPRRSHPADTRRTRSSPASARRSTRPAPPSASPRSTRTSPSRSARASTAPSSSALPRRHARPTAPPRRPMTRRRSCSSPTSTRRSTRIPTRSTCRCSRRRTPSSTAVPTTARRTGAADRLGARP